jgi:hypothetical protein
MLSIRGEMYSPLLLNIAGPRLIRGDGLTVRTPGGNIDIESSSNPISVCYETLYGAKDASCYNGLRGRLIGLRLGFIFCMAGVDKARIILYSSYRLLR